MPDFKFPCPSCKQNIQCDLGYVGAKINCPTCNLVIVVPTKPVVAEKTIEIKVSTLRKTALIGLGVLLAVALVWLPLHFLPKPRNATFKGFVDGTDVVHISGYRLWIEHVDWELPRRMLVNGTSWKPTWNNDKVSATYKLRGPLRTDSPASIKLTKRLGRGDVTILELPTPANNNTLSIKIDDDSYGGADLYDFTVSW